MPKIGLRIVKSAIAVYLCFTVYLLRGSGIPFYSAIAAVLCMQPELDDSKEKGKSRIIGTLLGGFAGLLMLLMEKQFYPDILPEHRYLIISLMVIPLIYTTLLMKQSTSAYLTCVVFMCVTISHVEDENPYMFALDRILDTLIGIGIALAVNAFHIPHRHHRDILIEVPMDCLLNEAGILDTHTKFHINRCIDQGMKLLISSHHTPTHVQLQLQSLHEPVSYSLMDGALRYDRKQDICFANKEISSVLWHRVYEEVRRYHFTAFLYEVHDEVLYIHYSDFSNQRMEEIYRQTHKRMGMRYVLQDEQQLNKLKQPLVAMEVIDSLTNIQMLLQQLRSMIHDITWVCYPDQEREGYAFLRIYAHDLAIIDMAEERSLALELRDVYKLRANQKQQAKDTVKEIEDVFYHGIK